MKPWTEQAVGTVLTVAIVAVLVLALVVTIRSCVEGLP